MFIFWVEMFMNEIHHSEDGAVVYKYMFDGKMELVYAVVVIWKGKYIRKTGEVLPKILAWQSCDSRHTLMGTYMYIMRWDVTFMVSEHGIRYVWKFVWRNANVWVIT